MSCPACAGNVGLLWLPVVAISRLVIGLVAGGVVANETEGICLLRLARMMWPGFLRHRKTCGGNFSPSGQLYVVVLFLLWGVALNLCFQGCVNNAQRREDRSKRQ
mmetsp:Transcript_19243/g.42559  ORF Transcript_19243/g.42559 Transcript_19243/m.42559 type:complete len:105 (+) Transcript_19243:104-418(+)